MTNQLYLASSNEHFLYLGTDFRLIKAHVIDDACDNVWLNQNAILAQSHTNWLHEEFDDDVLTAVQYTPFTQIQAIDRNQLATPLQTFQEPSWELANHPQILVQIEKVAPNLTHNKVVFDSDDIIENWLAPNLTTMLEFINHHHH